MGIDRKKYMDASEVAQLTRLTQQWSAADMLYGRLQGPLVWMVVDLALSTGLRASELARIKLADIDWDRSCLTVVRSKKRKQPEPESLMISSKLKAHLQEYIERQRRSCDHAELLVGKRGALTPQGIEVAWKRAVVQAGLTKPDGTHRYSVHCARHTMAVLLYKETKSLRHVQKQLGHTDPRITANMYADISDEDMKAALELLYK